MSEGGEARCLRPNRDRLEWRMVDLDGQLPRDHRARVVQGFADDMDLRDFYAQIGSLRTLRFCRRCGFSRPLRGWVRRAGLRTCASMTSRIGGCAAGCA